MNTLFEHDELRSYLLGNLSSERVAALELRILSDDQFYEQLMLVEAELVDQYVAGNLNPSERQAFESRFLTTLERRQQVRFGKLFREFIKSRELLTQEKVVTKPVGFVQFFKRPAALVVALVLIAVIGLCIAYRFAGPFQRGTSTSEPALTITLTPGLTRGEGEIQRISPPPQDRMVEVKLRLANNDYTQFRAELTEGNSTVKTVDGLKSESQDDKPFVRVRLPGEVLQGGDYEIKLSGIADSGQPEIVHTYFFRVTH